MSPLNVISLAFSKSIISGLAFIIPVIAGKFWVAAFFVIPTFYSWKLSQIKINTYLLMSVVYGSLKFERHSQNHSSKLKLLNLEQGFKSQSHIYRWVPKFRASLSFHLSLSDECFQYVTQSKCKVLPQSIWRLALDEAEDKMWTQDPLSSPIAKKA